MMENITIHVTNGSNKYFSKVLFYSFLWLFCIPSKGEKEITYADLSGKIQHTLHLHSTSNLTSTANRYDVAVVTSLNILLYLILLLIRHRYATIPFSLGLGMIVHQLSHKTTIKIILSSSEEVI